MEGGFASLPPLQPIGSKDGVSKSLLANGLNVPNSLVMTPITDGEVLKVCFISLNYYLAVQLVMRAGHLPKSNLYTQYLGSYKKVLFKLLTASD